MNTSASDISTVATALQEQPNKRERSAVIGACPVSDTQAIEGILRRIWEDVLPGQDLRPGLSFFELGGDSLRALKLVARLRNALDVNFSLSLFFRAPTFSSALEQLHRLVGGGTGAAACQPTEPGPTVGNKRPVTPAFHNGASRLSFYQQQVWYGHQETSTVNLNLAALLPVSPGQRINSQALNGCVHELLRRHEILRSHFVSRGGVPVQVLDAGARVRVEMFRCPTRRDAGTVRRKFRSTRFDLEDAPLIRFGVIDRSGGAQSLCVVTHRIIMDERSFCLLLAELVALYDTYVSGRRVRLPRPILQYGDYAVWEEHWTKGPEAQLHARYWTEQRKADAAVCPLPVDRAREMGRAVSRAYESFVRGERVTSELERIAHVHHATLFMTVFAAVNLLISRYTGHQRLMIGTRVASRVRQEVEGLIGPFTHRVLLQTDVCHTGSFSRLLRHVRTTCGFTLDHSDVPYHDRSGAPRDPGLQPPVPQLSVVYQDLRGQASDGGSSTFSGSPWFHTVPEEDLCVMISRTDYGMGIRFDYDAGIFDAATISQLGRDFSGVLSHVVRDPATIIARVPMAAGRDILASGTRLKVRIDPIHWKVPRGTEGVSPGNLAQPKAPSQRFSSRFVGMADGIFRFLHRTRVPHPNRA